MCALALVVFNSAIFYFGSSIRAYGLAVAFIMPCCAAFWQMAKQPTRANVAASLIFALLSCHTSYQNSYMLFAIGTAAMISCAICKLWARCGLILSVCVIAATLLFIYLPTIQGYSAETRISKFNLDTLTIGRRLAEAIAGESMALLVLWIACATVAFAHLIVQSYRRMIATKTPSLHFYSLMLLLVALIAALVVLRGQGVYPFPWHFTPLLAVVAIMVEIGLQSPKNDLILWFLRVALFCIIVALSLPGLWQSANCAAQTWTASLAS